MKFQKREFKLHQLLDKHSEIVAMSTRYEFKKAYLNIEYLSYTYVEFDFESDELSPSLQYSVMDSVLEAFEIEIQKANDDLNRMVEIRDNPQIYVETYHDIVETIRLTKKSILNLNLTMSLYRSQKEENRTECEKHIRTMEISKVSLAAMMPFCRVDLVDSENPANNLRCLSNLKFD